MAAPSPQPSPAASQPTRGHEKRDASAGWIFGIVLFLLVSGLAIHFILAGFQSALQRTALPSDPWRPLRELAGVKPAPPPGPRLQVSPPLDLQRFRAREEALLNSYGWVNRTAGVVRVPVARAMDLVLQQGLPTRAATNGDQAGPSAFQLMQQRPEHRQPGIKEDQ